jgi:sodium/hydrogen exchanger 5
VHVGRWEQFDKKYLSKLLLRKSVYQKSELWEAYQKINMRDAISVIDQVGGQRRVMVHSRRL